MRKLYTLLLSILFCTAAWAQTGELQGKVIDEQTGQGLGFVPVAVLQNGTQRAGTSTDIDGNYSIKPVQPGTYSLKTGFLGYNPVEVSNIVVSADKITFQNVKMSKVVNVIKPVTITAERKLVDPDRTQTGDTKTRAEIQQLATNRNNPSDIVGTAAGVFQRDNGDNLNVGGNRGYNNKYYVDGIPMRGNLNLPSSAIEQLTIVTGGIPAKYGDATGGIINITTRGPSRIYSGGLELATSEFIDPAGYKLANANVSGPLLTKNRKTDSADARIGFFLSAEYEGSKDRDPSAVGMWKLRDGVLEDLTAHPLQPANVGSGFVQRAQFVTTDQLEKVKSKQNYADNNYRFNGKLDMKLNNFMNLTIGGNTDFQRNEQDYAANYASQLFAIDHSYHLEQNTYRGFIRFTQRFASGNKDNATATVFQNAFYSIQADYSRFLEKANDKQEGDNPFNYGYVGKFKVYGRPTYTYDVDSVTGLHAQLLSSFEDTLVTFEPGTVNPDLAAYTTDYYSLTGSTPVNGVYGLNGNHDDYLNGANILNGGGLLNGYLPGDIYSLYRATGMPAGEIHKYDNAQYRLSFNGSVDLVRPSATKGDRNRHALEFGFEYEQRDDRGYRVFPTTANGLWGLARQLTNRQFYLDKSNPVPVMVDGVFQDTINYTVGVNAENQSYFDRQLRKKLGAGSTELINVDELTPSDLSIDMFSPDELFNNGNNYIEYWGYDWKGNRLKSQPDFFDFFNSEVTEDGTTYKNRPIGSFRPIYTAAYLQDKFNFRDLIFNIGLRVDRYDANQKVLKDLYSLFPIRTVDEATSILPQGAPSNIGSDYYVYVNSSDNPTQVLGYRDPKNDVWYDATGAEIADPKLIAQGTATGSIEPWLEAGYTRKSAVSAEGFKDYDPQWSVMPRIAFSFPISDEALFFAHYDVLTQRPGSGSTRNALNRMNPFNYEFFASAAQGRLSNPDLKPEKTVDYQVGFQQALGTNSALTLSLTYKELKDMVQVRKILYAVPVESYTTYGNRDFGTVKSFQASYEMRRTRNIRLEANYTLQFAEGTGSDQTSSQNLVNSGTPNLRTVIPFDYDQRHTITATVDYRYGEGSGYDGPVWGNSQILKNTGLNTIFRVGSGTPFSRQIGPSPEVLAGIGGGQTSLRGNVNGSRLPYTFKIDMRLDRDFVLSTKKNAVTQESRKSVYFNAYVLAENLLNTKNIVSVYKYTGSASDDGYLSSPTGQQSLLDKADPQTYVDLYNIKVVDPDNYTRPRSIRVGLSINF